jgi:hypothetical protein
MAAMDVVPVVASRGAGTRCSEPAVPSLIQGAQSEHLGQTILGQMAKMGLLCAASPVVAAGTRAAGGTMLAQARQGRARRCC